MKRPAIQLDRSGAAMRSSYLAFSVSQTPDKYRIKKGEKDYEKKETDCK